MIRYFFKPVLKNIQKHKVRTFISLLALTVGLVLIALYIKYEQSFNKNQVFGQNNIWEYFEQNCPDSRPEVFLPGIVSGKHHEHSSPTISLDGKTMYWTTVIDSTNRHTIMQTEFEENRFLDPTIAPFSGKYRDFKILISEQTSYLGSKRPINNSQEDLVGIWTLKKDIDTWGNPEPFVFENDSSSIGYRLSSISTDTSLYFEKGGLYSSKYNSGEYKSPEYWSNINHIYSNRQDWMFFIAYDNSYMIFVSNRDGGYGSFDLYICFRTEEDEWSTPINMGNKINTKEQERCPGVTPDGKYLFFTRPNPPNKDDIWWVSSSIIEKLR